LTAALVATRTVQAEPPTSVAMDYQGTPGCPDGAWFIGRVRARTNRVAFEPGTRSLALLIRVDADALEGRLDLRAPGPDPLVRTARGKTCDEVADALALILAMALDPTVTPSSPAPAAPAAPPSVQTPPAEPPRVPVASAPPPVPAPLPPLPSTHQARPKALVVDIGAGPAVAGGMAPTPSFGGFLFLEVSTKATGPWAPAVIVVAEVDHAPTTHTHENGAYGSFTRGLARLEACPLRFPPWPTLGVRACGAFEYGMLAGKGEIVRTGRWVAPALGLRAEWRPYPAVLLVLDGLVARPLVRDRFFFAPPDITVYQVPAWAVGATLGMAATLL
jgi:hypothetical protein